MRKNILLSIALIITFFTIGCGNVFNSTIIPYEQVNFTIDGHTYGPNTIFGQLLDDGVVEDKGYFNELIPVDAYDDISLKNKKSDGMKITVKADGIVEVEA